MQPLRNPSRTLPGPGHVGTNVSPTANGCVRVVFIRGSCSTGRSTMPMSGLPLVRSRMYIIPVFPACIRIFRVWPWYSMSASTGGAGLS